MSKLHFVPDPYDRKHDNEWIALLAAIDRMIDRYPDELFTVRHSNEPKEVGKAFATIVASIIEDLKHEH